MSFEGVFAKDLKAGLGKDSYVLSFKDRSHISKAKVDAYSGVKYIGTGELVGMKYESEISTRYVAITNITYDLLLTVFDVNTRGIFLYRIFRDDKRLLELDASLALMKKKKPNFEARIIGLQSGQDYGGALNNITNLLTEHKSKLMEVDLFGTSTRHIAMDMKLGMSFNMLLENRLYRPGEMVNSLTVENFEAAMKQTKVSPNNSGL